MAPLADKIGRKPVLFIALAVSFIAVGVEFYATTNPVFFTGKLLNGIMIGAIGSVMISYIGEVRSPNGWRKIHVDAWLIDVRLRQLLSVVSSLVLWV